MTTVNLKGEPITVSCAENDPPQFLGILVAYVSGPQATQSAALPIAIDICGGGTVTKARGGWVDGNGNRHIEDVTRLEVAFPTIDAGKRTIAALVENARQGGQAALMYHVTLISGDFAIQCDEL